MSVFSCVSPIDGEVVASRPFASAAEIQTAVAEAKAAQKLWRAQSLADRAVLCTAFIEAMLSMEADICLLYTSPSPRDS